MTKTSYKTPGLYLFAAVVIATALDEGIFSLALIIGTLVIGCIHTYYSNRRRSKILWASINRPIAVVDYGLNKFMQVPEQHRGYVTLCHASEVEEVYTDTVLALTEASNPYFETGDIYVTKIYFRYGENVLHTQEQHEAYVKECLDKALLDFHTKLVAKADKREYIRDFYQSGAQVLRP